MRKQNERFVGLRQLNKDVVDLFLCLIHAENNLIRMTVGERNAGQCKNVDSGLSNLKRTISLPVS